MMVPGGSLEPLSLTIIFSVVRDVVMVGVGNALTSLYSGFVIFSVLGYMAHIKGVKVDDVTAGGKVSHLVKFPEYPHLLLTLMFLLVTASFTDVHQCSLMFNNVD